MKDEIENVLDLVADELRGVRRNHDLGNAHSLADCERRAEEMKSRAESVEAQELLDLADKIQSAAEDPADQDLRRSVVMATGELTTFVLSKTPMLTGDGYRWQKSDDKA